MECYLSIAPSDEKNMMHAPCPPTTPTMNMKIVARNWPRSAMSTKAAKMWAAVRRTPPIKMVFLGPYLL